MKNKFYLLMLISTLIMLFTGFLLSADDVYFTRTIILSGIIILASITWLSYYVSIRSVSSENPHRFVRGVMGGTFIKFALCIAATVLLLFVTHKKLHKPDLFFLMFVYAVFTVIETVLLSKVTRK